MPHSISRRPLVKSVVWRFILLAVAIVVVLPDVRHHVPGPIRAAASLVVVTSLLLPLAIYAVPFVLSAQYMWKSNRSFGRELVTDLATLDVSGVEKLIARVLLLFVAVVGLGASAISKGGQVEGVLKMLAAAGAYWLITIECGASPFTAQRTAMEYRINWKRTWRIIERVAIAGSLIVFIASKIDSGSIHTVFEYFGAIIGGVMVLAVVVAVGSTIIPIGMLLYAAVRHMRSLVASSSQSEPDDEGALHVEADATSGAPPRTA